MTLSQHTIALKAVLDAMPGVVADPVSAPRALTPIALMYKIQGKIFAILAQKNGEYVIVKCEPQQMDLLKAQYAGVGHRSHLDRRFWICVELAADVPATEVTTLVKTSYDLVRASLTRKQQAALADSARSAAPRAKPKAKVKTKVKTKAKTKPKRAGAR